MTSAFGGQRSIQLSYGCRDMPEGGGNIAEAVGPGNCARPLADMCFARPPAACETLEPDSEDKPERAHDLHRLPARDPTLPR